MSADALQPSRAMTLARRAALGLWVLAIWIGSLIPLSGPVTPGGDKLQHFAGYGGLALLAMWNCPRPLPVWLACTAMGVAIEFAQALTPYRSFDVVDMLANGAGALLGVGLALLAARQRKG